MEVTMPIIRHPAPAGTYCGTCQSSQCSHAAAGGSTTPLRRLTAVLALTVLTLLGTAGAALAGPGDGGRDSQGYVSGYDGPGSVVMKTEHAGSDCVTHHSLYVNGRRDGSSRINGAVRAGQKTGAGWVCVNKSAYDRKGLGSVWSGTSYRGNPRG